MLDDENVLKQRDPDGALQVAAAQPNQARHQMTVQKGKIASKPIKNIVIAGMGGSVLAPLLVHTWLAQELKVPLEIINSYTLPKYVDSSTLVIANSYSGNTEETVSVFEAAVEKSALVAVTASGGTLLSEARSRQLCYVEMPRDLPPCMVRMAFIYNFKALTALLAHFDVIGSSKLDEITDAADWLAEESALWQAGISTEKNYAKQLAQASAGKSAIFYGGYLTEPVAYKWKISWNETAKNIAFYSHYPEFDHNEIMSWMAQPVEKPFVIYDIVSQLEHPQILKRFAISSRVLSGFRPESITINLSGDSLLKQLLWGGMLADAASTYMAILNGVNPNNTKLIEELKKQL